jgi:GH18 family chitinase
MPLDKVNIGLAFYSRPTDMSAYWYGYNGCYETMTEDGWYHCDDTDKDFWFNTPDVIAAKTDYAINHGYGGVMIWHYNCDLPSTHEGSLLRAVGETVEKNY